MYFVSFWDSLCVLKDIVECSDIDFKLLYNDNCILKCLYEDMFESSVVKPNDKLNWACRVRDILFEYVFYNIWISQYGNHVNFFMCEFKQRMKDNFISESPKCHLYRYIFDNNVL